MSQPNQPSGFPDPNAQENPPYPTGPQSAPHPYGNAPSSGSSGPYGNPGYGTNPAYNNSAPQQGSPYGTTNQNPYSASSATPYSNYPPQGNPAQNYPAQNNYFPAVQPNPYDQPMVPYAQQKSKLAAGLLGIFLGTLGVHNFYLGKTGIGLVQLLCSVLSVGILAPLVAIWALIEGILILTGSPSYSRDSRGIPLRD